MATKKKGAINGRPGAKSGGMPRGFGKGIGAGRKFGGSGTRG